MPDPIQRRPDAYEKALPSMPPVERQWLTYLGDERRPTLPYGRDYKATADAAQAVLKDRLGPGDDYGSAINRVGDLSDFVHGAAWRKSALGDALQQGYPEHGVTDSYLKTMDRAYPWKLPSINTNADSSAFNPRDRTIDLGDPSGVTPSLFGDLRHEWDHALGAPDLSRKSVPVPASDLPHNEFMRQLDAHERDTDLTFGNIIGGEIPPSMADPVWLGHDFQQVTGKPLNSPFTYPSGVEGNVGTMARQAATHGMFDAGGPSMAQLLASPSGQAYMRMITTPPPPLPPPPMLRAFDAFSNENPLTRAINQPFSFR